MVLDVSYSRVLGQRPTFYCPLVFLRKTGNSPQAIRRNRLRCFHVWFVSDRWQWVAPMFGRVCIAIFIQCNQCTMFIRKNKIRIIILQPVDGATVVAMGHRCSNRSQHFLSLSTGRWCHRYGNGPSLFLRKNTTGNAHCHNGGIYFDSV